MKFIISGGGTGGHIYPAIAIAQTLKSHLPTCEILFVGAEGKMEMEKVPKAGFQIVGLPIRGLQRSLSLENLKFPFRLALSLWKAYQIVKDFRPQVCIGVGGFASGALMQVAVLQGIPTLIQEQNSHAGLTNKILSKYVRTICTAYPAMEQYFPPHKIVLCGNPVRKDLVALEAIRDKAYEFFGLNPQKKTLLVVGGSLGAKSINQSILEGIQQLLQSNYQVLWQTGKVDNERILANLKEANLLENNNLVVKDFIYEMQYAYSVANVIVSRAGALAISEICLAAKPTIFVPFPYAAEDHQTKNAQVLVNSQAALIIKDHLASKHLVPEALSLLQNDGLQQQLSQHIKAFARPQAAEDIVKEVMKLVEKL